MHPKVVVANLRKKYGPIEAARGVSFEIAEGEIFGLIGPNGAGKTTTLECVIGLREPDAGTVEIAGIDARRRPRDARQKIGAALQMTALHDKITPREALVLFGAFYRRRARPEQLIERFGLADKADVAFDTLSGGQRQRLALALAFVNEPELVLLDEPTTGLDARSRRELHAEILRMKQDGHTVLLTTHNLDEAEALCDRIAVIHHGVIAATGATREIVARSSAMPAVSLVTDRPLPSDALAALPDVNELALTDTTARFRTHDVNGTLAALVALASAHGAAITELHVQRASLEDVFLELTGGPVH
jgi:ABC-2 type transport system ATP-binding protein